MNKQFPPKSFEETKALLVAHGIKFQTHNLCFCPFHDNKRTPAFHIRSHGKYKCYGCGEWGDYYDLEKKLGKVNLGNIKTSPLKKKDADWREE